MEKPVVSNHSPSERQRVHIRRLWRFRYLLKWLPTKRTLNRYPILRKFGRILCARNYLWSFSAPRVGPAILIGSIIAFLPIFGFQLFIVTAIALILKVNLPVLAGLQFISNPITLAPMYLANYKVGYWLLDSVGIQLENGNAWMGGVNATMFGGIILGSLFGLFAYAIYVIRLKWPPKTSEVAL